MSKSIIHSLLEKLNRFRGISPEDKRDYLDEINKLGDNSPEYIGLLKKSAEAHKNLINNDIKRKKIESEIAEITNKMKSNTFTQTDSINLRKYRKEFTDIDTLYDDLKRESDRANNDVFAYNKRKNANANANANADADANANANGNANADANANGGKKSRRKRATKRRRRRTSRRH